MAKAKFIKGAIKHPGVEIAKAKRNGVSTHQQLEADAHSKNPHVRGRGQLGLRLEAMHHKKEGGRSAAKKLYPNHD